MVVLGVQKAPLSGRTMMLVDEEVPICGPAFKRQLLAVIVIEIHTSVWGVRQDDVRNASRVSNWVEMRRWAAAA